MWNNLTCEALLLPVRSNWQKMRCKFFLSKRSRKYTKNKKAFQSNANSPLSNSTFLSGEQVWTFRGGKAGACKMGAGWGRRVRALYRRGWNPLHLWTDRMTDTAENITIATPLASGKNIGESILKKRMHASRMRNTRSLTVSRSTCQGTCVPCMPHCHACPPATHAPHHTHPTPCTPPTHTPPCGQNSWHTVVKTLPCHNFVAGGKDT